MSAIESSIRGVLNRDVAIGEVLIVAMPVMIAIVIVANILGVLRGAGSVWFAHPSNQGQRRG